MHLALITIVAFVIARHITRFKGLSLVFYLLFR